MKKSNEEKINENILAQMQMTEQVLKNISMQKQVFQAEVIETNNALDELKKNKDDVFKIIGSIMFKSNKESLQKELEKKIDILDLRLKSIEKQEKELKERVLKQRDELLKTIQK